jgi:hypothetical protein
MALKTVRIIAYAAGQTQTLKTVNVFNNAAGAAAFANCLQGGAPADHQYPTCMASGAANSSVVGLPNVYISGYSAPA